MRILYDGQIYKYQAAGGVIRYFANLISRLPQDFVPYLTAPQQQEVIYPIHPNLKVKKYKRFRPLRVAQELEKYYFNAVTTFNYFDFIHPTYYLLLTQQELKTYKSPIILTVYDMVHEIFRSKIDPNGDHIEQKRKAILAAHQLLCISENTKKDLINWYAIPEEKITVTYLASGIDASLAYGDEQVPAQPYYLYVGSRDPNYKNFETLLLALKKVVSLYPDIKLCVVGYPFNKIEIKRIAELNLAHAIEHYTYASDKHLAKLYRCSIALVYPSLYEGFGIPPLEAMCCGTPVVASNCSSIPEVVGEAGILFNPQSISDLTDILLFLLDHPTERDRLIVKGLQRATAFSWDKTVAQTLKIYYSLSP